MRLSTRPGGGLDVVHAMLQRVCCTKGKNAPVRFGIFSFPHVYVIQGHVDFGNPNRHEHKGRRG